MSFAAIGSSPQGVNLLEESTVRVIAPPGQEGWLCDQENAASATEIAQTGWLFQNNVLSNHPGASRHPS